jgi:hypothetical protein
LDIIEGDGKQQHRKGKACTKYREDEGTVKVCWITAYNDP